ncbi:MULTISPECIES: DUF2786 domain-containing protein [unclassified Vibrio]|uniref:DUF2786 domain-containing protein n=1 Tax=unclassified Vibrio TaxID=2614977 RepID=UPI001361437A|nr:MULTISPECIES: DUF2786 domain-containing protein [unclassified Vibrio]NAW59298.1 DUF2786 domain-containing protein [Vibrio sp. V36_P2S2PM302]NAX21300.1 DUF2786 domain-containing protein [Vibrio sp. V39_P1S14PM300]NAX24980.1 DUF2786 domain-containing protein [Vibrio sp. V38_P2S17PM301]NAX31064.1 DUF2786 domain-containing protein [Vibrio sp. V37_P2S8PM304]
MTCKMIERIKKLLRLAQSANEHEAAAAMSRAQTLMQQHGLSYESPELSDVQEILTKSRFKAKGHTQYFSALASMIARAFGCKVHVNWNALSATRGVVFTGHHERPEVAAYTYDVLERQLINARKTYITTLNKRIKRSTKTARADLFCEGWVASVERLINDFALTEEESTQLNSYLQELHPDLKSTQAREASTKYARGGVDEALWAGRLAGKSATLNQGVNGQNQGKLTSR